MSQRKNFKDRYKDGNTPWDCGKPGFNLQKFIHDNKVEPCNALDIGCGTGENTLWMARKGFDMTGVDLSEVAIHLANQKKAERGVKCNFYALDFLEVQVPCGPYQLAYDRGCFHVFDKHCERVRFAQRVKDLLTSNGRWLSFIGSSDDDRESKGPPKRSASDIIMAIEPYFRIISLTTSYFEKEDVRPPKIWVCLMEKR